MTSVSSSNSTNSSSGIDVATVVADLMKVANQPLNVLNSKVSKNKVIISDLGLLKAKITSLKDAILELESPTSYSTTSVTSSNSSAVTASSSSGAAAGRYSLSINQTAEVSNISVGGFGSLNQNVTFPSNGDGFTIKVGQQTFFSKNPNVGTNGVTTPALNAGSITEVNNWINSVALNNGLNIRSSLLQASTSNYALVISGTQTGVSNAISFSGLDNYSAETSITGSTSSTVIKLNGVTDNSGSRVLVGSSARDSNFTLNGLAFQRSSNTISDAISNVTFNLVNPVLPGAQPSLALVTVGGGDDKSSTIINNFVTKYNDLIVQYKSMIANKYNSASGVPVGSLTGQESTLSFMSNIKSMISKGALTATGGVLSLVSLGIDLQRDGTLKFNSTNYSSEIAQGLLEKLKTGISIGGVTGSSANLSSNLASIINPMGTIDSAIQNQNKQIDTTNVRVNNLNNQLKELEKSYISRFSSLNALLFKLNDTSNQLTNSLTAVTNINKGTN